MNVDLAVFQVFSHDLHTPILGKDPFSISRTRIDHVEYDSFRSTKMYP